MCVYTCLHKHKYIFLQKVVLVELKVCFKCLIRDLNLLFKTLN